tara:strand:+ start:590 stop:748 length:159 start_codon:yes stop_codon:yes gene_type:complete
MKVTNMAMKDRSGIFNRFLLLLEYLSSEFTAIATSGCMEVAPAMLYPKLSDS